MGGLTNRIVHTLIVNIIAIEFVCFVAIFYIDWIYRRNLNASYGIRYIHI